MKTIRDPDAVLAGGLAAIRAQFQVPGGFPPEVLAAAEAAAATHPRSACGPHRPARS